MTDNRLARRAVEHLSADKPTRRTKEESATIKEAILNWAAQQPHEREHPTPAALAEALDISKQYISNVIRLNMFEVLAAIRAKNVTDIPAVLDSLLTQATQRGSTKAADVFLKFVEGGSPKTASAQPPPLPPIIAEALARLPIKPAFRADDGITIEGEIIESSAVSLNEQEPE